MKWSIQQLRKIQKFPYEFSDTIDYSEYAESVEDILDIDHVFVSGTIDKIDDETYRIVYTIKTLLTLQCALTLDPVPYEYEKTFDEVYSKIENDEYFLIEKNTIDLTDMVWTNILIEKPINVTLPFMKSSCMLAYAYAVQSAAIRSFAPSKKGALVGTSLIWQGH